MEGFGVPRGDRLTTPTSPTTCSHCPPQPACAYGDPQNVANPTAPLAGPANGRPRPSSSVQFSPVLSPVQLSATPCTAACQASLSITNSCSLPKLMSTESVIPSNHLTLCHPLLLPPSIFPRIRVFSNESALPIRWPKDWSFSFKISPPNEHSGLIFRTDWLYFLVVQRTLKSLIQHHSSKASVLWGSADGYCSHEIKRCLLLGRKAMTNLGSILKAETFPCQQESVYLKL